MIRTHLITGFLGVGKTTAILHWLSQKPAHEKWAVLVNEFGEVGVDGAVLKSQGAVVKEVPGGCVCCVSGLPFQMGLNLLIAREKPDVLLIEPTGLGHPRNILQTLTNEHYASILDVRATITLLDPRHLSQPKYQQHDIYRDQIALADVLVANKADLAQENDRHVFEQLLAQAVPAKAASAWVEQGVVDWALLDAARNVERQALHPDAHASSNRLDLLLPQQPLAVGEEIRCLQNRGQGYASIGWLITGQWCFSARALRDWLACLDIERGKGIVRTDEGMLVLNLREGVLSEMPTRDLEESRLELIGAPPLPINDWQQQLLACRLRETDSD